MRSRVKAVVSCDINSEEFIDKCYRGKYDVVMCFLCLESAVKDLDDYKSGIAKVSSQLKEGGYFLLYSTRRENCDTGFYTINGVKYYDIALKRDFVLRVLEETGLIVTVEDYRPLSENPLHNIEGMMFFHARKA